MNLSYTGFVSPVIAVAGGDKTRPCSDKSESKPFLKTVIICLIEKISILMHHY